MNNFLFFTCSAINTLGIFNWLFFNLKQGFQIYTSIVGVRFRGSISFQGVLLLGGLVHMNKQLNPIRCLFNPWKQWNAKTTSSTLDNTFSIIRFIITSANQLCHKNAFQGQMKLFIIGLFYTEYNLIWSFASFS